MKIKPGSGNTQGDFYQIWLGINIIVDWIVEEYNSGLTNKFYLEEEIGKETAGIFDDILVCKNEIYNFYQVKHTINLRGDLITYNHLIEVDKISIIEMYKSFQVIKEHFRNEEIKLIIYSNKSADTKLRNILNSDGQFLESIRNVNPKARGKNRQIIKQFLKICKCKESELKEFLNKLFFYLRQENLEGLKSITSQKLSNSTFLDLIENEVIKSHKKYHRITVKTLEYYINNFLILASKKFNNYNYIMEVKSDKPKSFEYLEPKSIIKFVNHSDIKEGNIIRIKPLLKTMERIISEKNKNWIILQGPSGLSKTTQVKIFLYDIKNLGISNKKYKICITEDFNYIQNFESDFTFKSLIKHIKRQSDHWLLFIDDLHNANYGSIKDKLSLMGTLCLYKNVRIICTSRLSLQQLKPHCSNDVNARNAVEKFEEINIQDYSEILNKALIKLIRKIKPNLSYNSEFMKEFQDFKSNFIFSILAIKYWKPNVKNSILNGIQTYLKDEFEAILKKGRINRFKLILRVFSGACYQSLFDTFISSEEYNLKVEKKDDIEIALFELYEIGLLKMSEMYKYEHNLKIKTRKYILQHAELAHIYIKALKIGLEYNGLIYDFKDLIILKKFKANLESGINIEEIFLYFKFIENLELRNLEINSIPKAIGNLKFLKTLNLSVNNISNLPDEFENLNSLESLNMEFNNLSSIPKQLFSLTNLKFLNLGGNQIKSISNGIGMLSNLNTLILIFNKIKEIPIILNKLNYLEELYLCGNIIDFLPESIGDLDSLKVLYLGRNNLKTLPNSFKRLKNLTELDFFSSAPIWIQENFDNYIDFICDSGDYCTYCENFDEEFCDIKLKQEEFRKFDAESNIRNFWNHLWNLNNNNDIKIRINLLKIIVWHSKKNRVKNSLQRYL